MSKAEERALKAYPIKIAVREGFDENLRERKGFIKGYHQAEKDLALTWEDIREHVKRLRYAVDANCIVTVRNACECLESSVDLLVNSIDTLEVKEVDLEKEIEE